MKLWFVIYVGSHIGGSIGPLPYDMTECQNRAAASNAELKAKIAVGKDKDGNDAPLEMIERAKSIKFVCEYAPVRPAMTYAGGKP